LTAAATEPEAQEVRSRDCEAHLSSNRTCEIGLERSTGERFESFVYAIDELTR
jgi:D-lactate dehydrogenase